MPSRSLDLGDGITDGVVNRCLGSLLSVLDLDVTGVLSRPLVQPVRVCQMHYRLNRRPPSLRKQSRLIRPGTSQCHAAHMVLA